MKIEEIESYIGKVPDFPKPGILFYDISTLIINKNVFSSTIEKLSEQISDYQFDSIAAIDARGFVFGAALASYLNTGMIMIRKKTNYLVKLSLMSTNLNMEKIF